MELVSSHLQFTRDARRLVVAHADRVAWHDTSGASRELPIRGARGVAVFGDRLWALTAAGVERWTFDGRTLGTTLPAGGDAVLVPALAGPAAGACGHTLWLDDTAGPRAVPLATGALPFSGLRTFTIERHRGGKIVRLGTAAWGLPVGAELLAGAALFDGAGVALFVGRGGATEAWSSTLAGEVRHRIALPPGELRLAARRGLVLVRTAPAQFIAIDLRYGKQLGGGALAGDDFAIDPDGRYLATLHGGEVEILTVEQRSKTAMGDFEDVCEETEHMREGAEIGMDLAGIPGAGVLGLVNGGVDLYNDVEDGNGLDAVIDGGGLVSGGAELVGDMAKAAGKEGLEGTCESVAQVAEVVTGGLEFGKGVGEVATDDGYGGQTLDGIHDMLTGGSEALSGIGGETPLGQVAGAFGKGMEIGDWLAPMVFGDMNEKGGHTEEVPEDGQFNASTGNGAIDWVFGVGDYTNGRW